MSIELLLAVVAGAAFSLIALAYRSNSAQGVAPAFAAIGFGLGGLAWFGLRSFYGSDAPGLGAPGLVWVWGLLVGLSQGALIYLYRVGLQHGPLGPLWCAGSLTFVSPAIFSAFFLREQLNGWQRAGMAAAFLCVVVSSLGHGEEPAAAGTRRATAGQRLLFGALLLAMVFLTGLLGVVLKHMAVTLRAGAPLNPRYNDCFMLGMYASLTVCVLAEIWKSARPAARPKLLIRNALLAGVGSVVGMVLTARVSDMAGGIGFALISVSCVLAGALVTSFVFGEKRNPAWYATLVLAVAAVLLFNMAG
jgi:drug/metabolite transporter (DMT)-like permease